jgi:hypothetical protein
MDLVRGFSSDLLALLIGGTPAASRTTVRSA